MAVLTSRVALITGGSRGVGAEIARKLASLGARVALVGRDEAALTRVANETGGLVLVADVTDRNALFSAVQRAERELGTIGISVHNAGIAPSAPLAATDDATWDRTMAVNVKPAFWLAQWLVPKMVAAGWGRIIHVASNAGLTGYAYTSAYCASKHALVGFTRALAAEIARTPVTVNAVCPGFLETEMTDATVATIALKTKRSLEEARSYLESLSPQKRLIQTAEVAHVVGMLCADEGRALHGTAIPIDGGQVMT